MTTSALPTVLAIAKNRRKAQALVRIEGRKESKIAKNQYRITALEFGFAMKGSLEKGSENL